MKYILWILVLIVVIVGAWLYFMGATAPEEVVDTDMHDMSTGTSSDTTIDSGILVDLGTPDVTFTITGKNFEFSRDAIIVNKGDVVQLTFTSEGGFHDWVVDGIPGARTKQINTGQSDTITFVATDAGEYEFYCSVGNHRAMGMVGTLIVE